MPVPMPVPTTVPTSEPVPAPTPVPTFAPTAPKLTFGDVQVVVMGQSGKMTIIAGNDKVGQKEVVVAMDSIIEVDADGGTIGQTGPSVGKHR